MKTKMPQKKTGKKLKSIHSLTEKVEFPRDRERRREFVAKFGLCGTVGG